MPVLREKLSSLQGFENQEKLEMAIIRQIKQARSRIYKLFGETPFERLKLPLPCTVWMKREDLSPVRSYKWRGAYNAMSQLKRAERNIGVVAASAGNHAQGVAISANQLGIPARIYMPSVTPMTKQRAVKAFGGRQVEIVIVGKTYDESSTAAKEDCQKNGRVYIHPFDDPAVIGGQATLSEEIIHQCKGMRFDVAYLQIGGGGMAAGNALWLRKHFPHIKIVGVEMLGQHSMYAAMEAGKPVDLDEVDTFCDGTSVKRAGNIPFHLLHDLLDDMVVVTREDVCSTIKTLWDSLRLLPETSGALGLAGLMTQVDREAGKNALVVISGGNLDLTNVATIVSLAETAAPPMHGKKGAAVMRKGDWKNLFPNAQAV